MSVTHDTASKAQTATAPFRVVHPETGATLLEVTLGDEGPALRLFDYEGRPRIYMDACPKQGAQIEVSDLRGEPLAWLGDNSQHGGSIGVAMHSTAADQGRIRAMLLAEDLWGKGATLRVWRGDGEPFIPRELTDLAAEVEALKERLAAVEASRSSVPAPFRVIDPETGEHCFEIHTNAGEGATFALSDPEGNLTVDGGQGCDGIPFLRVHGDREGRDPKDAGRAVELRADGVAIYPRK